MLINSFKILFLFFFKLSNFYFDVHYAYLTYHAHHVGYSRPYVYKYEFNDMKDVIGLLYV